MDEKDLIKHLLDLTDKKYEALSKKIFGLYDKENWYEKYITIASIIQKEAASKEEMSKVSSVIYNRLNKGMKLQMDGTLNYSKYSHTRITPKMIKEDKSEYNTYKNKGLPDNPVCAVEVEAIKAAIKPANTDYLYFMKSADGSKHIFSNSYKKHIQVIKKVKKESRKIKKEVKAKKVVVKEPKQTKTVKTTKKVTTKTTDNSEKLKNLWR